jgi:hypothetical protein
MQNFMKIRRAILEPLHVDVQTDGQTDMTALHAAFLVLLTHQCAEV